MSSALVPVNGSDVTPDQQELIRRTVAANATDDELKLFLYDCRRRGTHPLDRLVHFTKRGGKYTPITGIDFMRTQAHGSGACAGIEDAQFNTADPGSPDFAATVSVKRIVQGIVCDFTATARWSEYFPGDASGYMWKKMPHTMLGKCAEALALRKGFPQELAGLYAKEEMDQATSTEVEPLRVGTPAYKPRIGARALSKAEGEAQEAEQASEARKAFYALKGELGFATEPETWVRRKIEPWLQRDVKNQLAVTADEWQLCADKLRLEVACALQSIGPRAQDEIPF